MDQRGKKLVLLYYDEITLPLVRDEASLEVYAAEIVALSCFSIILCLDSFQRNINEVRHRLDLSTHGKHGVLWCVVLQIPQNPGKDRFGYPLLMS